jgi:tRNA(Ile)-lysidine synthase
LYGRGCTKSLKKLFIENLIPARKRPLIPVVADDLGVLAVFGVGMDARAVPSDGDAATEIKFEGAVM